MHAPRIAALLPAAGLALLASGILAADLFLPRNDENVILWGDWRHQGGAIDANLATELQAMGWSPLRAINDHALLVAPLAGKRQAIPSWVRLSLRAQGIFGCMSKT